MQAADPSAPPKPRIWLRLALALAGFVAVVSVAGFLFSEMRPLNDYAAFFAALDADEPGWRLDALVAAREEVPDEENSALVTEAVHRAIPRGWSGEKFDKLADHIESPEALDGPAVAELDTLLAAAAPALPLARRLADMPRGRHALNLTPNPWNTILATQQNVRQSASLLRYEGRSLAHCGRIDDALRAARGSINAGRSLGDEPFVISHLVRTACVMVGLGGAHQALSQGEASDAALAATEKLLALEESHNGLRCGLLGERASQDALWRGLIDGKITTTEVFGKNLRELPGLSWREWLFGLSRQRLKAEHVEAVRQMTKMVAVAELPYHEQGAAETAITTEMKSPNASALIRETFPAVEKTNVSFRRKIGAIRALRCLVAAERFRLANKAWPKALGDLVPAYLPEVPRCPFDGKLLRYARRADSVVAWGAGEDGVDNGGVIDHKILVGAGKDLGYEFWDVAQRRRPAKPRPVEPKEGGPDAFPGGPGGP